MEFFILLGGLIALIIVPIVVVLGGIMRQERALQARCDALLRSGVRAQATIARVQERDSIGAFSCTVTIVYQGRAWEARVRQMMSKYLVASFHPGRAVIVSFSPEQPAEATFDLRAMGYDF